MAKDDKAKVRVFFAEVEGNNETLRNGLNSIAAAVKQTFQTKVIVKQIESSQIDSAATVVDAEIIEDQDEDIITDDQSTTKPKRKAKKQISYTMLGDINFYPESNKNFIDFFSEANPSNQQEHLLVCVYYLERVLQIDNIGNNHIYTCLKKVGKPIPNDIGQIARNTSNRKGWLNTADTSNIRITTDGENHIEQVMLKTEEELFAE